VGELLVRGRNRLNSGEKNVVELGGKVAIITGASAGIGKGIAQAFSREGVKVVIASRNQPALEAIADELRSQGATVLVVPTDVTNEAQIIALFERTMQEFGRLDILVNNAGIYEEAALDEISLATWQRTIDVNLTGPFLCSREAMKIMKRQGGGRIINIGSISAQMPRKNAAPYSCAKLGLVALTKTTALEGRDFGVVASCLHPGNVATAQMDDLSHEPMMAVEDIVSAVVTMVALPPQVNMLEAIVLPVAQLYLGRG
jgi:NAD(P)-dependent dehydrogenase (short-subunit alcohol dehydrogenase family)